MPGQVIALGTASHGGAPIEPRDALRVAVGLGVVGDRYSDDTGHFKGHPDFEVTLVEAEDAEAAGVEPLSLRRNIVTRGVDLETLIGKTFRIGTTTLHGMRVCLPCGYIERHTAVAGLKERLRGGLRARVVRPGDVRIGDAVEVVPVELDADMRAVVEATRLAFVATVTADGRPNLSPKGTVRPLDLGDGVARLFFLEIASEQTRKNLATNDWMEINVVDPVSRRGYRFLGRASVHQGDSAHGTAQARIFADEGARFANRGAIVLAIERALPILSPGYWTIPDERDMRAAHKKRRDAHEAAFEKHLEAHGAFRLEVPRDG